MSSFQSTKESELFFLNFFSASEVIIFAKRLGILKRLIKKNSYGKIGKELKMSPTTIAKMANRLRASPDFKEQIQKLA